MDSNFLMERYSDGDVKCEVYYGLMNPFVKVIIVGVDCFIFKIDEDPEVIYKKLSKYSFARKVSKKFIVEDLTVSYLSDEELDD